MRIYLTGFMGSGKSTIGRDLSKKMQTEFLDLDDQIEKNYKTSIPLIFEKYDESAFRKLENEVLHQTINSKNVIIATGGGTPCFYDNMDWMNRHGLTVYIKMSPVLLTKRVLNAKKVRPLIRHKSEAEVLDFIKQKLPERELFYNKADIVFWGDKFNLNKLFDEIVNHPKSEINY